jgi:hypothetical protein
VAHPDLLIGPAFELGARCDRLPEQGPLDAIGHAVRVDEIGRHIPPFDPKPRMRAVIGRKRECLSGNDRRESVCGFAESGKALRERLSPEPEQQRAAGKQAARYRTATAHWRKS